MFDINKIHYNDPTILKNFGIDETSLRIKELTLEKFKRFEDKETIPFYKNEKHNISLVIWWNATWKTTISEWIFYCLSWNGFYNRTWDSFKNSYFWLILEDNKNNNIEIIRNHWKVSVKINNKNIQDAKLLLKVILNKIIFDDGECMRELIYSTIAKNNGIKSILTHKDEDFIWLITEINKYLTVHSFIRTLKIHDDWNIYDKEWKLYQLKYLAEGERYWIAISVLLWLWSFYKKILVIDSRFSLFDWERLNIFESKIKDYEHQIILLTNDRSLNLDNRKDDTKITYLQNQFI